MRPVPTWDRSTVTASADIQDIRMQWESAGCQLPGCASGPTGHGHTQPEALGYKGIMSKPWSGRGVG